MKIIKVYLLKKRQGSLICFLANVGKRKSPCKIVFQDRIIPDATFEIDGVTLQEVRKLILQIDISKNSGIEGIPAKVIKVAMLVNASAIQHLFLKSLLLGICPRKWVIGYINILPKGGDKKNPSNW